MPNPLRTLQEYGQSVWLDFVSRDLLKSGGLAVGHGDDYDALIASAEACDDPADLPVPGQFYTFGIVKGAQARGDFEVLAERGRRALRAHISGHLDKGLETLGRAVEQALQ